MPDDAFLNFHQQTTSDIEWIQAVVDFLNFWEAQCDILVWGSASAPVICRCSGVFRIARLRDCVFWGDFCCMQPWARHSRL